MRKILLFLSITFVVSLCSCSKSPETYLNELEKLKIQYDSLIQNGKTEEAAKIPEKVKALASEMDSLMKVDKKFKEKVLELNNQYGDSEEEDD